MSSTPTRKSAVIAGVRVTAANLEKARKRDDFFGGIEDYVGEILARRVGGRPWRVNHEFETRTRPGDVLESRTYSMTVVTGPDNRVICDRRFTIDADDAAWAEDFLG